MFRFHLLPWEYGIRNLLRRPSRTLLTLSALTTVVLLVLMIVGFIRGLESSLTASGDPDVVLVHSRAAEGNVENSAIPARIPGILSASLEGIQRRFDVLHVSPEMYLGTRVRVDEAGATSHGVVRGVTDAAPLVRRQVRIVEGSWPSPGEVLAGRLAPAKLACSADHLAVGDMVGFEGRSWRVSGRFVAGGSALESELWCLLPDLQQALKRQDLSVVAMLLAPGSLPSEAELFCKARNDLELQAIAETEYYAALQKHFRPVRLLAWLVV
ncbi:MAG: ABC transporter permease, partial [Planctomycetota bacterium]